MADWIKWQKGLAKKPEVFQMAIALGRSRHEVAGLLCEFWEWADDNIAPADESATCPGFVRITSASDALIDALVGLTGFASAMSSVGWISLRNGRIEIPNFGRHNGKSAKRRALDAESKRTSRRQNVGEVSASKADKKRTRREEKREEEKREDSSPNGEENPLPPPVDTPEFRARLSEWIAYKAERREPYKDRGRAAMVSRAANLATEHGLQAVLAAMQRAMANGWAGWDQPSCFEKAHGNGNRTHVPGPGQLFDAGRPLGPV